LFGGGKIDSMKVQGFSMENFMMQSDLWVSVLKRIKPTINRIHFLTWLQHTNVLSNEGGVVTVAVPTAFAENWISNKYDVKILQALKEIDPVVSSVKYSIVGKLSDEGNREGIDVRALFAGEEKKVRKVRNINEVRVSKGGTGGHISSQMLNGKYRLSNFVIGKDNRLPHAACNAVANMPGGIYNPLYIYGGVGLGKTHLIQAVGNEILRNFPDMIVKYITAEKFVTEVVEAIGKRDMKQFKNEYRKVDCFLVDDIQFFARKNSSQQEFFHTFDELYGGNKQIIITSDRPPLELDDLDERLKSRFGMGMVVELMFPDFETRLAILNEKCKELEVIIDPEVLSFIASNIHNSVRELEGVLRQIVAETQLSESVVTIRSVAEIIKRLNKAQKIIGYDVEANGNRIFAKTTEDIMRVVAEYYNLTVSELMGKDRHKEVMVPRQVCMYLIKNELGESYERIGTNFGGRNHTTVIHACNTTVDRLKRDVRLVRDINAIKREMGL
jgi:chromosomal replication initiator protein